MPNVYTPTVELFGQTFCNVWRAEATNIVESMIGSPKETAWLVCVKDVALTMRCRDDVQLYECYRGADMVFVDGRGLYYASRLLGQPLSEMVGGPGLYEEVLKTCHSKGYSVYFLGATPEALSAAVASVEARYPGLVIAGAHHGYLDALSRARVIEAIKQSRPQVVFIGMATPHREAFIAEARAELRNTVCIFVGGVFDVEAGLTKLAPRVIGLVGLEWLYRCWQEPRRLGRRYFQTHPRFLALVIAELCRRWLPRRA